MGAAASVRMVYSQALGWLKVYIDSETYMADFNLIDKDHDGGISFGELQKWVLAKVKSDPEGGWHIFKDHPQVMQIAHKAAGMGLDSKSSSHAGKVVDVSEFRLLLMHLFAVSILMAHFDHADDMGTKQLGFDEFKKAIFTFCETHAHEQLTDEQIQEDFELLDINKSDSISFLELCMYCCKFIDPSFRREQDEENDSPITQKTAKLLGIDESNGLLVNDLGNLGKGAHKSYYSGNSESVKTTEAFKGLAHMIESEMEAADVVQEKLESGELNLGGSTDVESATQYTDAPAGTLETHETIDSSATAASESSPQ